MKDMNKEEKVKISIQGGGLSYQGELDQRAAGQIVAICLSSITKLGVPTKSGEQQNIPGYKLDGLESPSEYYNRHMPNRNPDKILTLAGYIKEVRHVDSFHPNEIKALFRDVAEVLPANFMRDMKRTIKLGWISTDSGKNKGFYITRTGLRLLNSEFPKELKVAVCKTNRRKKKEVNK